MNRREARHNKELRLGQCFGQRLRLRLRLRLRPSGLLRGYRHANKADF